MVDQTDLTCTSCHFLTAKSLITFAAFDSAILSLDTIDLRAFKAADYCLTTTQSNYLPIINLHY